MAFEARILGPVEATRDGRSVPLGSPKQRAVFALLVLGAGRVVATDRLIDELWGERPPESPSSSVQVYVSRLRRSLRTDAAPGPDDDVRLVRRGTGYQLELPTRCVDAQRFADLVTDGRELLDRRPADARQLLEEALALTRGPALADVVGTLGPAGTAEARRLDDLRLVAQQSRLRALLAQGEPATAAADAAALVREHPLQEELHAALILGLYRCGRQADALAAYEAVRAELAEELGVDPGAALRELHAAILRQDPALELPAPLARGPSAQWRGPPAPARHGAAAGRVPEPLTSLVGRDDDVGEVLADLGRVRLTTLVGTGGSGKSRLAQAVARGFPDAVSWVDVAALDAPEVLERFVVSVLGGGAPPGEGGLGAIAARLGDSPALLVLDGCEHLVQACAGLARRLLGDCPGLRVLATSREPLAVAGEVVWPVDPLPLPPAGGNPSVATAARSPAVRLWCDRAAAALRGFTLDEDNVATVVRLCRRLDGLPLAVELAAARLRVLSLEEIADALDEHLGVLVATDRARPARHRTLRATLDWSYRLLAGDEQSLLAELATFHGGFTLEGAAAVRTPDPAGRSTLDLVSALIDRSLVSVVDRGRPTRYRLLETVRATAAEHLDGERARTAAERHLAHHLALAETAEARLTGPRQQEWLELLDGHVPDLVGALQWSVGEGGDPRSGLRLVSALWRFWYLRGHYAAGRAWLDAALRSTAATPDALRARASAAAGRFAYLQGDYRVAEQRLEEARRICERLGDGTGTADVLQSLGSVARERGDYPRSRELHRASRTRWAAAGRPDEVARSSNYLGFVAWLDESWDEALAEGANALEFFAATPDGEGRAWSLLVPAAVAVSRAEPATAHPLLVECLRHSTTTGYREGVAWSLDLLGTAALVEGDPVTAREHLTGSLRVHRELGDRWRTASVLEALAAAEVRLGDAAWAATLLGAAAGVRTRLEVPVPRVERRALADLSTRLGAELGPGNLAAALAAGRRAPVEQVLERAAGRVAAGGGEP